MATKQPYFWVLTDKRFESSRLTNGDVEDFFRTGRDYIAAIRALIELHFDNPFHPKRAMDFGCGVGRLTLAMAGFCDEVVGVDTSEPLLEMALGHSMIRGTTNVEFVSSLASPAALKGEFDFINSFIVFQHIPPVVGMRVLGDLLVRLQAGGIAALHFAYARDGSRLRQFARRLRRRYSLVNGLLNMLNGVSPRAPCMPMYEYDLTRVLDCLYKNGCSSTWLQFTSHGDTHGAILLCKKAPQVSL